MEARQNESPTLPTTYTPFTAPLSIQKKTFPRFLWRTFQKTAEMFHSNEKLSTFFKVLVENVYLLLTGHCRSEPYLSYQPIIFSLHIVCTFFNIVCPPFYSLKHSRNLHGFFNKSNEKIIKLFLKISRNYKKGEGILQKIRVFSN